ncbi:MAG: hypothetical protein ACOC98_10230 [Thermodesulfobacteriota bacterium]
MKRWHWLAIGILAVLVVGGIGLQLYANQTAAKRVEAAFASAEAHDVKITHEGVRYNLMDGQVTVSRMVLTPTGEEGASPLKIDEMVIREIDEGQEIPAFADVSIRGVQLTGETFGKGFSEGLKQLEYGDLRADLDLAYRFSGDRTEINVEPVRLSIPQVADLECRIHLGNLVPIETAHPSAVAGFPTWRLHSLDLQYADQSLAPRIMKAVSEQNGINAQEIIQTTIDQILKSGPPPAIAEGLAQARRFVGNPGTLTLNAAPEEPMPLQQVVFPENPLLLLDTLGVTLKAG